MHKTYTAAFFFHLCPWGWFKPHHQSVFSGKGHCAKWQNLGLKKVLNVLKAAKNSFMRRFLNSSHAALLSAEVGEGTNLCDVHYLYKFTGYVFSISTQNSIFQFFMWRNMLPRSYLFCFLHFSDLTCLRNLGKYLKYSRIECKKLKKGEGNLSLDTPLTTIITLCVPCVNWVSSVTRNICVKNTLKNFLALVSNHKIGIFEREVSQYQETKTGLCSFQVHC